jgi:hypothetical protein
MHASCSLLHTSELASVAFSLNLVETNLHNVPSARTQTFFYWYPVCKTWLVKCHKLLKLFTFSVQKKQMARHLQFGGE